MRVVYTGLVLVAMALSAMQFGHAGVSAACGPGPGYHVASLRGEIDPGSADFLSSAVSNAESECAGHFVFVLTTNGGDGESMQSMIAAINQYRGWGGTFDTLVAPQGAFAFSAGSYIAQASDKIYMARGTTIGSATPIISGIPLGQENTTLTKDISAFASYMETLTVSNGRNSTATRLMVTRGVSYTDQEALRYHVVDGLLDSTSVQGALTELSVPASTPIETPGIRSIAISILSNPNVSGLLFLIGVFSVLADVYHPTIVLTFVGAVLVLLALFGLGTFGASPLAVVLMVIGAAFIFLEVKTQHGVSAVIGVVTFIVGFLLVFQFPPSSPLNPSLPAVSFSGIPGISYALLFALGAGIVIASIYLRSIREALTNRPRVNEPSQAVGKTGTMETDLKAGGKGVANVASEQWSVISSEDLKKGDAVKVKEVRGLSLVVEKQV